MSSSWKETVRDAAPCGASARQPVEVVGDRFFIECERSGRRKPELLEIDPLQGTELARIPLDARVTLAAGGQLCGLSETHLFCGRIAENRFEVVWKEPKGSVYDIDVAGEWIVAADDVELVVRRVKDGGIVWKRGGYHFGARTDGAARVVLMSQSFFEVVRLSDGVVLARIPKLNEHGGTTVSGEGWILIWHHGGERAVHLVDAESRSRAIASNVDHIDQLLGGVFLTQNARALQAYSLTQFALPYARLGSYEHLVGSDVHGRWIAMIQNLCLYIVDAQSGKAVALRGADGRPGDARLGAHRAAAFSPDGKAMLYIKSNGDRATVIYRDLASGARRRRRASLGLWATRRFSAPGRSEAATSKRFLVTS